MGNLAARGFTLIEVLVALCLLSMAALSIVGLQWRSLDATHQSALHGMALQLAADLADELRAGVTPDISAALARATLLPGRRAVICRDPSPWDDAAGAYRWDCGGAPGPLVVKVGWLEGGASAAPQVLVVVAPALP